MNFNLAYRREQSVRTLKLLVLDGIGLTVCFYCAYLIRFEFVLPPGQELFLVRLVAVVLVLKLLVLYGFRQFHTLPGYFGVPDLAALVCAMGTAEFALGSIRAIGGLRYAPPWGVIVIDSLLSLLVLATFRLAWRLRRERLTANRLQVDGPNRRVGIIGAGEAGAILTRELQVKRGLGLQPVAFFDDDRRKWQRRVHDVPVVGPPEVIGTDAGAKMGLQEIIISMPSAPAKRIREIIGVIQQAKLPFRTVPSLLELALGKVQVSQLRPVEVEDLLGRPPIQLETEDIQGLLVNQCVMVTGAGGSIGSELCRQITAYGPQRLLLVERSETQMFVIEQELIRKGHRAIIRPLVADILDENRMSEIFQEFRPGIVFHAAAHKHVPMMESQPGEAIRNNAIGTALLAKLALRFAVERFVLISTDKAINPTSVMGATKRLGEMFLQALYAVRPECTRFMAVRFGNVLGSSGSVIPVFKEQIAAGGPVTITHPDIRRYFMTIPEAVGLVLQSAVQGSGGEVFVLDMGKPIKILDLAKQLIRLSGMEPNEDIQIEYVGLRPGEKLFEETTHGNETLLPTTHPKILRLCATALPLSQMEKGLQELAEAIYAAKPSRLKAMLKDLIAEYQPGFTPPPDQAWMLREASGEGAQPKAFSNRDALSPVGQAGANVSEPY